MSKVQDITSKVRKQDKITNGGWNSDVAQKEYTESKLRHDLRKQKSHGRKLNSNVVSYLNEGMKLSREQRLKKAYPDVKLEK